MTYVRDGIIRCMQCGAKTDRGIAFVAHRVWCIYHPKKAERGAAAKEPNEQNPKV
jgi:hypothetical protein